jgi:hypothetical protein
VREGLERLRGLDLGTQVILVSDRAGDALPGVPVTLASARDAGVSDPFVLYFGEGPAYALLRREGESEAPLFHTGDRSLVEHLAFELQRDLGIALSA